jgi:multidrug efflux pump subunit AcrA (membrane-fusion protein)
MKRKNLLILIISAVVFVLLIWYFSSPEEADGQAILTEVQKGTFVIDVTTTGELDARSSEKILGPSPMKLRNARIWQYRIEDIISDGTVVDSGQWVATIDRSDLENKIKDQELDVEKLQTQFLQKQLDTTMTLRNARDELVNLEFTLEEKQIIMDQSIYEPPATQRQVKLDLEKTQRTYNQSVKNYQLKKRKANADMREVQANLSKRLNRLEESMGLLTEFVIHAPKSGMLTYKKGWDGKKIGVGSQISTWENIVATLPDLTAMNSQTYVNEIDISKVAVGQQVEIEIDAFPGRKFTGEVHEVANMGEQMRNSNAKVFEVIVHINEFDSILRPSMTTKNTIITDVIDDVLHLPIECVGANDSISYIFRKRKRQQIIPGRSNESEIIILAGLNAGDEVYLVPPKDADDWPIIFLDEEIVEQFNTSQKAKTEAVKETQTPEQTDGKPLKNKKGRRKPR